MANHKSRDFRVYSEAKICAIIFLEGVLRNSYGIKPFTTEFINNHISLRFQYLSETIMISTGLFLPDNCCS